MKYLLFVSMLSSALTYGGIDIPRGVFTHAEIIEAESLAKENGKALSFVLTDPRST